MAATKNGFWPAAILLGLALPLSGCTVDLSTDTPGAMIACLPTDQQLTDFQTVMTSFLQNTGTLSGGGTGCGLCHSNGGVATGTYNVIADSTESAIETNFCTAKALGAKLANHPQESTHGGGAYTAAQIQALIDWVDSLQ